MNLTREIMKSIGLIDYIESKNLEANKSDVLMLIKNQMSLIEKVKKTLNDIIGSKTLGEAVSKAEEVFKFNICTVHDEIAQWKDKDNKYKCESCLNEIVSKIIPNKDHIEKTENKIIDDWKDV